MSPSPQVLRALPEIAVTPDPIELLKELVAIPSVNPMGGAHGEAATAEAWLTDFLEQWFRRFGLPWQRQTAEPGRENIVARLDGHPRPEQGGRVILLAAHQDTVPATGMSIPPFTPTVRDGRLYGRGACDVKGGMAAMLTAVARIHEKPPPRCPTVLMACTVNEENGFSGAQALPGAWERVPRFVSRKPDAAIVAEPTSLQVVVAHKGLVRWRCHTHGKAAHSSRPEAGDNAIFKMARALVALQRYQKEVVASRGSHPLCGSATISVGTIHGGISVNTVPDHCSIEIDRRLAPGETPEEAYRHVVEYLAKQAGLDFPLHHDPPYMQGPPLSDQGNGPLAARLAAIARGVAGACSTFGVPYATDGAFFAQAGIPTVIFGPGSISQAHTSDEWIAVDEVRQAAEIYYRFLLAAGE